MRLVKAKRTHNKKNNITTQPMTMPQAAGKNCFMQFKNLTKI